MKELNSTINDIVKRNNSRIFRHKKSYENIFSYILSLKLSSCPLNLCDFPHYIAANIFSYWNNLLTY